MRLAASASRAAAHFRRAKIYAISRDKSALNSEIMPMQMKVVIIGLTPASLNGHRRLSSARQFSRIMGAVFIIES